MVFLPFLPSRRQFAFVSPDLPVSRVSTGWQEKAAFKTHLCAEKGWHHTHWRYWPIYWNPSAVINHPADHTHTHTHTHTQQGLSGRKEEEEGDLIAYCRSFIFKFHCDRETKVNRGVEKENMFVVHFKSHSSSFEEGGGSDQMCLMKGLHSNRNNKKQRSLWNGVLSTPW